MQLLNVKETAKLLRISVSKVYRMLSTGELVYYQIGSRKCISMEQIQQFLSLNEKVAIAKPESKRRHF